MSDSSEPTAKCYWISAAVLRRIQMEGLVNEMKKSMNQGQELRVNKGGEE